MSPQMIQGLPDARGPAAGATDERPVDIARTAMPRDVTVALGRAALASGATLDLAEAPGPVLVIVEAGTIGIESRTGEIWKRQDNVAGSEVATDTLAAGYGAIIPTGTALTLRVLGNDPAIAIVVSILPTTDQS